MDYFTAHFHGPSGLIVSLLLVTIRQPVVARTQVNVMPYASGRAGPFETCVNVTSGEEGRCMFAMDCFRARGRHVGICTKGFYFGSCCSLPKYSSSTANDRLPSTTSPSAALSPSGNGSAPSPPPLPLTADNLPRVPIVLESNDIDGPAAPSSPFDPLDLSFWPDLLADIYGLKPQPMASHKFPYSTFHAPSTSGDGNAASATASVASTSSIAPVVNVTSTSTVPPMTTASNTAVMTTVTTTTTTTLSTSSSTSTTSPTTTTTSTTTTTTTPSSTSSSTVTQMSFSSTSGTTTSSERIGSTKPNVTVIYANVTAAAVAESETPGVVPIVESWLEEDVHTVDEQPMTSIPSTSASTVATTTQTSAPSTNSTATSSTIQSTTVASTTTKLNSTGLPGLISNVDNVTFTLLPSSAPSLDLQERLTSAVCGKPMYRWPKIVSGENARLGQWPWQVTLQEKTRRGYFHKCGASLLSKDWVITAAHCLSNVQPESLLVRMGGIDFASVEDKWIESRVQPVQHPQFNIHTQQNDIALLKLVTPLVAYQSSTLPICLPDKDMEFDGDQSFVSGWGRLGEKSPISTRLQYVGVPIINNTECEKIYQTIHKKIDRQSICAGYAEGLKDSCEGDSGGPMMVYKRGRWVLAGIISWGVGCARPNQPGVSTRVTEFLDWIQSTLDDHSLPAT